MPPAMSAAVCLDSLTDSGSARKSNIPIRAIGRGNSARLGPDREVEALGAADHLEDRVAHRLVAGQQPMQVVDARDRLLAQSDDEVALAQSRALRRAAALDLHHAHAGLAREVEVAHVA